MGSPPAGTYVPTTALYDGYLWTRRIRHLLPASSLRLKLFEREEAFYQRYLRAEDVRRSLARREGYSH